MKELQVTPWKRYGKDRLYVNLPDGRNAAWFDRRTQQINIVLEVYRDAVHDVLAPYLADAAALAAAPAAPVVPVAPAPPAAPVVPTAGPVAAVLHPDDDLAVNRPGEAIRAKLDDLTPGFWRALVNRLLRRRPDLDGWRKGLAGEQAVGAELERLAGSGWRVLHSIPLPREVDIDHLLIGPGGVFSFNTKHHRGGRIWVGDDSVKIGGQAYPYVRKARAEARRASAVLSGACGFDIGVGAVLAFVEAAKLTVVPSLEDVYVTRHDDIAIFNGRSGVWRPADVEKIYTAARDRRIWPTT